MKIAIAIDESLGPGFLSNATACIASGLFNGETDLLGRQIEGADFTFIPITKTPILVVKQNKKPWGELLSSAIPGAGKRQMLIFKPACHEVAFK